MRRLVGLILRHNRGGNHSSGPFLGQSVCDNRGFLLRRSLATATAPNPKGKPKPQPEWEETVEEVEEKEPSKEKKRPRIMDVGAAGGWTPAQREAREEEEHSKKRRRDRWFRALKWSPLPILTIFTYTEFRRLRDPEHPLRHWEISFYRMLPWRTMSRTWGFINSVELPLWARVPFLTWYSRTFGCQICEAEIEDLTEYRNLGEFFRRALKPGARPICPLTPVVSPADGTVLFSGPVQDGMVQQVKGVKYSLQAFLGPKVWEGVGGVEGEEYSASLLTDPENNCLYTSVIYLAPGDYHRFHSPVDWTVKYRRHFPGELLSVNPRMAHWISGLFTLNERAVYVGDWAHGFFSMTAVGATNVGSIRVYHDPSLATNTNTWGLGKLKKKLQRSKENWWDERLQVRLRKGAPFGEFNLGSTIVLLFEGPKSASSAAEALFSNSVQNSNPSSSATVTRVQVGRPLWTEKEAQAQKARTLGKIQNQSQSAY